MKNRIRVSHPSITDDYHFFYVFDTDNLLSPTINKGGRTLNEVFKSDLESIMERDLESENCEKLKQLIEYATRGTQKSNLPHNLRRFFNMTVLKHPRYEEAKEEIRKYVPEWFIMSNAKPIISDRDEQFPSCVEASKVFGVSPAAFRKAIILGYKAKSRRWRFVDGEFATPYNGKVINSLGETFEDVRAASKHCGVNTRAIQEAIACNTKVKGLYWKRL